jgi:uncharacterized protein YceH (UPF0502 family)
MFDLDAEEQRVLGTLIEKQLATPQYYPLTLAALVQGCNQSTSREPVTNYTENDVRFVIGSLKDKQLIRTVLPSHGRSVDRYGHRVEEHITLIKEELALLGVLMLRGPQTESELKTRTERLAEWEPPDTTASVLERLAKKPEPLAQNIGRGGGRQDRWVHLLGPVSQPVARSVAQTDNSSDQFTPAPQLVTESVRPTAQSRDQFAELEERVARLEAEITELREQLGG